MAENESINVPYSKVAAILCSIEIRAKLSSLSSDIVERREVFIISFNFEKLRSADATVIGAVNKMRNAVVTFGNTSSNLNSTWI